MNFLQSDEAQATIDFKLKLFAFSTKSTNITAKYTQTDRRRRKGRIGSSTKRKHNKKKTIPTKIDLLRWAISHNKHYLLHCKLKPKTSNHHRLTQHNNSSFRQKKIQEPKNLMDPKIDRSSIHQYHITMGSESRRDTWKRSSRRRSKRSTERRNLPYRNISPTGLDTTQNKQKKRLLKLIEPVVSHIIFP
jgi:hypothetical protein